MAHSAPITFKARSQALSATSGGKYQSVESEVIWEAGKTAVIVVDMWDDHWCPNAAKRVVEMAKPMNAIIKQARALPAPAPAAAPGCSTLGFVDDHILLGHPGATS
ncbi:MAG: hypothetical protein ACPHJZ_01720, partial [Limisphaerales bacterium]